MAEELGLVCRDAGDARVDWHGGWAGAASGLRCVDAIQDDGGVNERWRFRLVRATVGEAELTETLTLQLTLLLSPLL